MANEEKMHSVIADVCSLSGVPAKAMSELTKRIALCIANEAKKAKDAGKTFIVLDIGIGTLSLDLDKMQTKFVPGKMLKGCIKSALADGVDPLELALERAFTEKLLALCEEEL